MKIVQSFWSKPFFQSDSGNCAGRRNGGWLNKRYNYLSWALSCLQFRKYYENVELVTDRSGYNLLINQLGLPYTNCVIVLDDINHYHPDLWALGKLYAYSLQDAPFIHADGDIYIWEKLDIRMQDASLAAQNLERGQSSYIASFATMLDEFSFIPQALTASINKYKEIRGVNAGILGGTNVDFFKAYWLEAIHFIDANYHKFLAIDVGLSNIIFEQFLFHAMADNGNLNITYLLDSVNEGYDGLADLTGIPNQVKFVHPVSTFKKHQFICDLLENIVKTSYPIYHSRIVNLLHTLQI